MNYLWIHLVIATCLWILVTVSGNSIGGDNVKTRSSNFIKSRHLRAQVLHEKNEVSNDVLGTKTGRRLEKRHVPVATTQHPTKPIHLESIRMELSLNDVDTVVLDLKLNKNLIPEGYFERYHEEDKTVVKKPSVQEAELCHYQGKIAKKPESWAALSTCDGTIRGVIFDGKEVHYLEHSPNSESNGTLEEPHQGKEEGSPVRGHSWNVMHYKATHMVKNLTFGEDSNLSGTGDRQLDVHQVPHHRVKRVKRGTEEDTLIPYHWNEKTRYLELVMVVDNMKYKELGEDLKKVVKRTKDIANIVNAMYVPFNLFIALVGVVVWTERDEIEIKRSGDDTLSAFLHYRKERLLKEHPNDNAQLLTGAEFEDGVVGKAMQGPICTYKYSGGVNSDYKNNVIGVIATTVAHEIGHNFGLSHDDEKKCECLGPGSRCIMSPSSGWNRTLHWSSCSLKDMAYAIDHGMDYCMRNKPKSLYDGPVCGNGFTEPGEECDCGLPEYCENNCCDAKTCKLHSNATCAAGACCDLSTCRVKNAGMTCREPQSVCDLPEYCDGSSQVCPKDVFKLNGLECQSSTGQAYCYDGACTTHMDQCKLLWGPFANISDWLCYKKNVVGSKKAHCGYDLITEKYSACKKQDVKCGVLHCTMNSEKLQFGYESVAIKESSFVNLGNETHPCRVTSVDFGLRDPDVGMVPNGASCGDGNMCVNQKCVPVKSVLVNKIKKCENDCSGNGVCNSNGNCHCNDGYGGRLCASSGYGGSVDSGPAVDPYGRPKHVKILLVTFFGFIPLIAVIAFYLYYAHDYLKSLCKRCGRTISRPQDIRFSWPKGDRRGPNHRNGKQPPRNLNGLTTANISAPHCPPPGQNVTSADSFFGVHKGFSLSPIENGSAKSCSKDVVENNNSASEPTKHPEVVKCENNIYYSPLPLKKEILVKNSDKPSIKTPTSILQNRTMSRVSWAQPVASSVVVSPPSEDESANSDTPLYENQNSPTNCSRNEQQGSDDVKAEKSDSANNLSDIKTIIPEKPRAHSSNSKPRHPMRRQFSFSGSTSAITRLAAAVPTFVRNSLRGGFSHEDNSCSSKSSSMTRLNKQLPRNLDRDHIEISKPILNADMEAAKKNKLGGFDNGDMNTYRSSSVDELDSEFKRRSEERPTLSVLRNSSSNHKAEHGSKSSTPPLPLKNNINRAPGKVMRAQSMIQTHRNSLGGANYNSLRKQRPSQPPPKPPSDSSSPNSDATDSIRLKKAITPPPTTPLSNSNITNNNSSYLSPTNNFSPILKFPNQKNAPLAQSESPESLSPKNDNIYDTIDDLKRGKDVAQGTPQSDEDKSASSSLKRSGDEAAETLSTASSDNGGLLSEIILEIKSRNRESIYNSVDRKKLKKQGSKDRKDKNAEIKDENANAAGFTESTKAKTQELKVSGGKGTKGSPKITKPERKSVLSLTGNSEPKTGNSLILPKPKPTPLFNPSIVADFRKDASNSPKSSLFSYKKPSYLCNLKPAIPAKKEELTFPFNKPLPPEPIENAETSDGKPSEPIAKDNTQGFLSNTSSNSPKPEIASKTKKLSTAEAREQFFRPSPPRTKELKEKFERASPPRSVSPASSTSSSKDTASKPSEFSLYKKPVAPSSTSQTPLGSSSAVPNSKPTCAVNGVPKVTEPQASKPSDLTVTNGPGTYLAKINYASPKGPISNQKPQAMKPINSLPAPSTNNPAKEIIYASTSGLIGVEEENTGASREHLPTIRSTWSRSYVPDDIDDGDGCSSTPSSKDKERGPRMKRSGIYGSLGRKVATPVIRSNSLGKEKAMNSVSRKLSNPNLEQQPKEDENSTTEKSTKEKKELVVRKEENGQIQGQGQGQGTGYKPYNPYLNRPLTFSTFRPAPGKGGQHGQSSLQQQSMPSSSITKPLSATCSMSNGNPTPIVGVTSPTLHSSPTRMVKS